MNTLMLGNKTTLLFAFLLMMPLIGIAQKKGEMNMKIVTPEWVTEHLNDKDIRILDVRGDAHDYFAGHVPNAVHLADGSLRAPLNGVPVQYLEPESLAHLLERAGVKNGDRIVLYSDGGNVLGATMAAYVLNRLGHEDVMIMDGGWSAFKATQETSQQYPKYTAAKFTPKVNSKISVNLDEVKNLMGKKGVLFIDARPAPAYLGEIKVWMRNGHIPGAINIDWHSLMDPSNPHKFKSLDEIKKIYAENGVNESQDIVVYCGTSREASLEYIVLKQLLNYPKVRLYEGSWTEYSSHPELEMETGKAKTAGR